jgi:hypothetical protein
MGAGLAVPLFTFVFILADALLPPPTSDQGTVPSSRGSREIATELPDAVAAARQALSAPKDPVRQDAEMGPAEDSAEVATAPNQDTHERDETSIYSQPEANPAVRAASVTDDGEITADWQRDYDAFVQHYKQTLEPGTAPESDFVEELRSGLRANEQVRRIFEGNPVEWTLTFDAVKSAGDQTRLEFKDLHRGLTQRLTGPWAEFRPASEALDQWEHLQPGTRVVVQGTIESCFAGIATDQVTGEHVPWGMAMVAVNALEPLDRQEKPENQAHPRPIITRAEITDLLTGERWSFDLQP